MISRLISWWHARQRSIDLRILWPECKRSASSYGGDLDHAKAAFALHVFRDNAWTEHYSHDEIRKLIDELE